MKNPERLVLAMVLAGNALLWCGRLVGDEPRHCDFDRLQRDLQALLPEAELVAHRFADERLLPADYLLVEAQNPASALTSVYIGYYPRLVLLGDEPHDPCVCYPAQGFDVVDGPDDVVVDTPGRASFPAQRIEVSRSGDRWLVFYWRQDQGRPATPGLATDLAGVWRRYLGGRSDRAWVRIEFRAPELSALDATWVRRLHAIRDATAAAMR